MDVLSPVMTPQYPPQMSSAATPVRVVPVFMPPPPPPPHHFPSHRRPHGQGLSPDAATKTGAIVFAALSGIRSLITMPRTYDIVINRIKRESPELVAKLSTSSFKYASMIGIILGTAIGTAISAGVGALAGRGAATLYNHFTRKENHSPR